MELEKYVNGPNLAVVFKPYMSSVAFIVILIVAVFVFDIGKRWWTENEWRRRWRRRDKEP